MSSAGHKAGRPRRGASVATKLRIVAAAYELFLSEGFGAVTTDQLAKRAGVSKSTIYKHFGDMGGVFEAVVRHANEGFTPDEPPLADDAASFREALVAYGENLLTLLNRPDIIAFDQTVHEQARAYPAVARMFYAAAYTHSHAYVQARIEEGLERGFIHAEGRASDLADHLLSMWEGLAFQQARLGLVREPFPAAREWASTCVAALFPPRT